MGKIKPVRTAKELRDIINYVKAHYILDGKRPPRSADITKIMARDIDKDKLLRLVRNEIIRF